MGRLAMCSSTIVWYALLFLEAGAFAKQHDSSDKITSVCGLEEGLLGEDTSLLQLGIASDSGKGVMLIVKDVVVPLDGEVKENPLQSVDWLYTSSPHACQKPEWDTTQYAEASRVLLPVIFIVLCGFIVLNGKRCNQESDGGPHDLSADRALKMTSVPNHSGSQDDPSRGSQDHPSQRLLKDSEQPKRRHDIDFARIICVGCVVSEHSGGSHWTSHNVLFVLQWVLPYLYCTSAISWMMSKKGIWGYISRMAMVLLVGVVANWVVDAVTGRNWQGDFGNTIFQMFYVVMLIAMSLLTGPLRQALIGRKENLEKQDAHRAALGLQLWIPLVIYGLLTFVAIVCFVTQKEVHLSTRSAEGHVVSWSEHLSTLFSDAPIAAIQLAGALFLAHLACLFRANDIFPWLLLVHIYLPRVFLPWEEVGFLHNLELFVFAMVAESWKLRGQRMFTAAVQSYWPIFLFFCMIASMPDMMGRCDLIPATTSLERLRFYGIELFLLLVLVTGSIKVGDPYRVTEWLNYWALYAYCFHVAWARLLPIPYGAVITYSSSILVYLAWHAYHGDKSQDLRQQFADPGEPKGGPDVAGGG